MKNVILPCSLKVYSPFLINQLLGFLSHPFSVGPGQVTQKQVIFNLICLISNFKKQQFTKM